jgi:type I restriction enzyme S subunit
MTKTRAAVEEETDLADEAEGLPKGWRWALLSEVLLEAQPGFASGARDPEGVVQVRMNNVTTKGTFLWDRLTRVPCDAATIERLKLADGDIVFNNTNSTELVGKTALFTSYEEPVVFSNHFTRIRVNRSKAEPGFIVFWFVDLWRRGVFAKLCDKWVGQSAIKTDKLRGITIPLPPLPEQKRLAAILTERLDAIERARVAAEQQLAVARALPAARLREVFGSPEAQEWPRLPLATLLEAPLRTGISKTSSPRADKRCLTLSSVRGGMLDFSAAKSADVSDREAEGCWVKPGAFYVVRGNGNKALVGRGAMAPEVLDEKVLFPDLLIQVLPDKRRLSTAYLRFVWETQAVRSDIESKARTSAGIFKINQANLGAVEIPVPDTSEQASLVCLLAEHLEASSGLVARIEAELAMIERLPTTLLREAFAGKLTD